MRGKLVILAFVMAGGVAAIATGAYFTLTYRPAPVYQVPDQNIDLVKVGMSREEVIRLLGGPPGQYTPGGFGWAAKSYTGKGFEAWVCSERTLFVKFDSEGVATELAQQPTFYRTRSGWW